MALNCHGKSAIDVAASQELKDRLLYEYRGHCLLEACRQADLSKAKKLLSSSSNSSSAVAELLAFKHPYTGKTFLRRTERLASRHYILLVDFVLAFQLLFSL